MALAAALEPGGSGYARIRFEGPAVLTRGDRFILRAYSPAVTIGGGHVLDPHPPRSPIRNTAAAARFARLDAAATAPVRDESAVLTFVEERRAAGLGVAELASRAGLATFRMPCCRAEACARGERLDESATSWCRPRFCTTSPPVWSRCSAPTTRRSHCRKGCRARKCASACSGTPRLRCLTTWSRRLPAPASIVARERLALAGHQLSLTPEEERAREAIERMFLDAGLAPPDASALHGTAGLAPAVVERVTKLLVRQKTLVRIDTLLFHTDALSRLRSEVKALKVSEGSEARVDVAAFKLRYGIAGSTRFRCWSISIASA